MTVSAAPALAGPFDGNDAATSFPFDFKIFADSDLRVVLQDALTAEYMLTLGVDYSVSMNPDQNADPGGTITYPLSGSPLATGERLTVATDLELSQQAVFTNLGKFFPATVEDTFDRLTMLLRQIQAENARAIRVPVSLSDVLTDLPTPVPGAALVWDDDGTALVNGIPTESLVAISSFMSNVIQAVNAAEARSDIGAAADAEVVKLTGAQTVAGVKTFSSAPKVPDGAAADEPATKGQLDAQIAAVTALARSPARQTVLSGPVNSSGGAAFGGSTGATTVTATGTLIASAANGWGTSGVVDRIGSITNPSWTGLSSDGTYYLYLTVNADGTCTTGSTTLAPVYQQGGTYSTTNGQFTFNVAEMVGKVGDGSVANQAYRVFVGEVTVAASVVSAIIWYALRGEAVVETGTLAVSTAYALNHYLGYRPRRVTMAIVNVTTELNWAPGDEIQVQPNYNDGSASRVFGMGAQRLAARIVTGPQVLIVPNGSASTLGPITMANWKFRLYFGRGW